MSGSFRNRLAQGVCAAALAFVLGGAAAFAQSPYASDMQAGREAFEGSNYLLADRYFRGAVDNAQSDGQKATALYSLAVSAQKQGKSDEAREHASKALEASPKNSQAKRLLEELTAQAERAPAKGGKGQQRAEAPKAEPKADVAKPEAKPEPVKAEPAAKATAKAPVAAETPPAADKEAANPAAQRTPTKRAALAKARGADQPQGADETGGDAAGREASASAPPVMSVAKAGKRGDGQHSAVETGALPAAKPKAAAGAEPSQSAATAAKIEPASVIVPSVVTTLPAQKRPVLAAGFTGNGAQVALLTGPLGVEEKADQALEMKRLAVTPTGTGAASEIFTLHSDVSQGRLAIAPTGSLVASVVPLAQPSSKKSGKGATVTVHVWDSASVENTHAIEMPIADVGTDAAGIEAMAFSRNGRRLVIAHRTGLEILDVNGLKSAGSYRFPARTRTGGQDQPLALAVSANGRNAVMSNGTRLRIVDGSSVRDISPARTTAAFEHVALSDDGRTIAASSGGLVRLIEFSSGRETGALPDAPSRVTALTFSSGSDRLAVASAEGVKVYRVASRQLVNEATVAGNAEHLAFSADGHLLLAAATGGSSILRLDTPSAQAAAGDGKTQVATAAPAQTASEPAAKPTMQDAAPAPTLAAPASPPAAASTQPVSKPESQVAAAAVESKLTSEPVIAKPSRSDLVAARNQALETFDCDKVKSLDGEIGDAGQHGGCLARVEARDKAAERAKVVAAHKSALERLDCDAAKSLDDKIGLGDSRGLAACTFEKVLTTGSARDLYLSAAKYDADRDRGAAKRLYRAIVDRFPQDDLAIKAAERMTAIADQEASESGKGRTARGQRRP